MSSLFGRARFERDMADELQFHLDARVETLVQTGLSPDAAQRRARLEFGSVDGYKDRLREVRGGRWVDDLRADLVYTFRGFRRNPAVSVTAILTIAIAVGAVTSMFSVTRNLLLAVPPHVAAPDHLFRFYQEFPPEDRGGASKPFAQTSYPFYEVLTEHAQQLEGVAAYSDVDLAAGTGPDARMTHAVMVSAGFWHTLGVRPVAGRLMLDKEAHPATGARVVVLGHAFWQSRFGGRFDAVGETLRIKGQPYEIVGVAPPGFRGVELADVDLWLPLFASEDGSGGPVTWHTFGASYSLKLVARLKANVSVEQASAELTALQRTFLQDTYGPMFRDPSRLERYRGARALLGPLTGGLGDDLRPIREARVTQWLLGIAVVLVTIACSNVAGLLLLRAMRRRREIAVRLALGVSRARLARQLFTESTVLALVGGMAALLAVLWGGAWLQRTILPAMAWEPAGLLDPRILAVAGLSTLAAAFAAGVAPFVYAKAAVLPSLQDGPLAGSSRRPRLQSALLLAQGALSVTLLIGAGLFLRSLHNVETLDVGLARDEALVVQIDFSGSGRSNGDVTAFFERARERVSVLPGVVQASLSLTVPLRGARGGGVVRLPGRAEAITGPRGVPFVNYVTPGFFQATGMRMLEGHEFFETDRGGGSVIVVNKTMAGLGWGDQSPIGQCVYLLRRETCTTVVGVVADAVMFNIVGEAPHPYYFAPLAPNGNGPRALLVRTATGAAPMDAALRRALQELDSDLPFVSIETLDEALNPQIRSWRLGAAVFTAFGVLAMTLAMVGLWSSVSYAVSQRTREFAIRLAMGAEPTALLRLVLLDGLRNAAVAIAAGVTIAAFASRFIADLLFNVSPRDPVVFGATAVAVLAVAAAASLLPAWRSTRIHPADVLRTD
ncbi:MAG: ADOP family duplicated permease [Vicinamibacterales bacterium]